MTLIVLSGVAICGLAAMVMTETVKAVRPAPIYQSLVAVVVFRFFSDDLLQYQITDLEDWASYLRYAGAEHVYLYDNCQLKSECQFLKNTSETTYLLHPGAYMTGKTTPGGQISAYSQFLDTFSHLHTHAFFGDLDEYPFSPIDTERNFLKRFIDRTAVAQVLLRCRFFTGKAENSLPRPLRYTHTTLHAEPATRRTKPLVRLGNIKIQNVHRFTVNGTTVVAEESDLYVRHYWGERAERGPVRDTSGFSDAFHNARDATSR